MGQTGALVFEPAFLERWDRREQHVLGPLGSGKTTLLRAIAAFFDERGEGARELVEGGAHSRSRYPVLWLDFSDFSAASFADALAYLAAKMSALYLSKQGCHERCWCFDDMRCYHDVIEGVCDEGGLGRSLERPVSDYRGWVFWRRSRASPDAHRRGDASRPLCGKIRLSRGDAGLHGLFPRY